MKIAMLFPGQGAQHVGMGQDLYEAFAAARAVFDRAEAISELPLKKLCFEGPEDELSRTDVAQPAIFAHSAAVLASLASLVGPEKVKSLRPAYVAGLSLGEYSALFAANMIDFDSALRLVTLRGRAMQDAAAAKPSTMLAVMGLGEAKAKELCDAAAQGEVLVCANFNAPGQIVLSGDIEACKRAEAMAGDFGASGAVGLKVAGAFHSPFMAPAAERLGKALAEVTFTGPSGVNIAGPDAEATPQLAQEFAHDGVEVVANVSAAPYGCPCAVSTGLLGQLTGSVRWAQSMRLLLDEGVETFYEVGPGKVLKGLMRRIERRADVTSVNSRDAVEKLAEKL